MIVRILIWSLFDSRTTIDELRDSLPEFEPPDLWMWSAASERFGVVVFGDELPDAVAHARDLVGRDPDVAEEFGPQPVDRASQPLRRERRVPARRARRAPRAVSPRSGARTSSPTGTPCRPSRRLSAAWRGNRSTKARSSPRRAAPFEVGSRTTAATSAGNAEASADTAPTAPASRASWMSASGPDEDVETREEVALEALERRVGDLQPGEVRRVVT